MKNKFLFLLLFVLIGAAIVYQFFPSALRGLKSSVVGNEFANITGDDDFEFENGDGVAFPEHSSVHGYSISTVMDQDYTLKVNNNALYRITNLSGDNCKDTTPLLAGSVISGSFQNHDALNIKGVCMFNLEVRFDAGKSKITIEEKRAGGETLTFPVSVGIKNSTRLVTPYSPEIGDGAYTTQQFVACMNQFGKGNLNVSVSGTDVSLINPDSTDNVKLIKIDNPNTPNNGSGEVPFTATCEIKSGDPADPLDEGSIDRNFTFHFLSDEQQGEFREALYRPLRSVVVVNDITEVLSNNPNETWTEFACEETQSEAVNGVGVQLDQENYSGAGYYDQSKVTVKIKNKGFNAQGFPKNTYQLHINHTKSPPPSADELKFLLRCRFQDIYGGGGSGDATNVTVDLKDEVPIPGKITVIKDNIPNSPDPVRFYFVNNEDGATGTFDLIDEGDDTQNQITFPKLLFGEYTIQEEEISELTHVVCNPAAPVITADPSTGTATVILSRENPEATCTFTNTQSVSGGANGGLGKLTIIKKTEPFNNSPFAFTVKDAAGAIFQSPFLQDNGEMENPGTSYDLPLGTYEITEDSLYSPGYRLKDIVCDQDSATIDLDKGSAKVELNGAKPEITCTFKNNQVSRLFVTLETLPADFGGPEFADSLCRSAAMNAMLGGVNWKAIVGGFVEDDSEKKIERNASDVIPENVAFVRLPCVKFDENDQRCDQESTKLLVAENKADLLDGNILEPISRTQYGYHFAIYHDGKTWTGSKADGTLADNTCENWTSDASEQKGAGGAASATNTDFLERGNDSCNDGEQARERAVFCVETFEAEPVKSIEYQAPEAWTNPDATIAEPANEPFDLNITVPKNVKPGEPVDIEFSIKPKP